MRSFLMSSLPIVIHIVFEVFYAILFQLEEVMEKETYKKAREILEKFDPERFKALEVRKSFVNL